MSIAGRLAGIARRGFVLGLNLIVYPLAGLWPRSATSWVFGDSSGLFMGNPKYLFLWMTLHRSDIRVAWLSKNPDTVRMLRRFGFQAHRRSSFGGFWAALRSKVFVSGHNIAHVSAQLSKGATHLNVWHGVGLKAVGNAYRGSGRTQDRSARAAGLLQRLQRRHLTPMDRVLVTTSDFTQQHFSSQFGIPVEDCPPLGYSRLDWAFDQELAARARELDRACGFALLPDGVEEAYLYLPTFRDSQRPFLKEALPDLPRLSAILRARKAVLFLKPHPKTPVEDLAGLDNIRLWPDHIDFNTYLGEISALITDYSSVLYDHLAVRDDGIILYTFDMADYLARDRNISYPFEENVIGVRANSFNELCNALSNGAALRALPQAELVRLRERFWGGSARPASPVIVDYTMRRLEG